MADDFQYDVFLSHSSKDKAVVREVAERLREDGLRVWFDEWETQPGDSIPAKIEEGLEHSRVLVLCMSAHAFGSDWAQLESHTLRFRDPLNTERRFIPLRLDDTPLRGSLEFFLYIDWNLVDREQEYAKLLETCRPPAKLQTVEPEAAREQLAAIQLDYKALIDSYAFTPDGGRTLTGASDKTLRLWDTETGRCLRVLGGHTAELRDVAWGKNLRFALSGSVDKTVRLWDLKSGHCKRVLKGHENDVRAVAWSAAQPRILSTSNDIL